MCDATRFDAPDGLRCTRDDHPDHPRGHVYESSVGSWVEPGEVSEL